MKRNKLLSILLVLVMCVSLCACGGKTDNGENTISMEEIETYSEYIELTKENWNDYIEIKEVETIEEDAFGEENKVSNTCIVLKDSHYISEDNALELTYMRDFSEKATKETEIFSFQDTIGRMIGISIVMDEKYTCERIQGTILKLTVPDEKWNIDENGHKYLIIEKDNGMFSEITEENIIFDKFIE